MGAGLQHRDAQQAGQGGAAVFVLERGGATEQLAAAVTDAGEDPGATDTATLADWPVPGAAAVESAVVACFDACTPNGRNSAAYRSVSRTRRLRKKMLAHSQIRRARIHLDRAVEAFDFELVAGMSAPFLNLGSNCGRPRNH